MSKKKEIIENVKTAENDIVAGDKLLKKGVSVTPAQADEIMQRRLEYLQQEDMIEDETRAEIIMNSYAMNVYQSYLPYVSKKYLPISSEKEFKQHNRIRYFDITKWVIDAEEKNLDKIVNVYQVLSQEKCNIALIYQRFTSESKVMLAVSNTEESDSPNIADEFIERIKKALGGNFSGVHISSTKPGSPFVTYKDIDNEDKDSNRFYYSVAAISNLPSDKSEDFVSQNIEKLLDGIVPTKKNEEYTLVLLAAPFQGQDAAKAELSGMYSSLSSFMQWQSNATVSESKIVGAGVSKGTTVGANVGVSAPFVSFGFQAMRNVSKMVNEAEQVGKNTGVTKTYTNYPVKHLLETIEKQIARIEESTALGMWKFAAYAISEEATIAMDVAHMYLSLTQGDSSFVSKSAINLWEGGCDKDGNAQATHAAKTAIVLSEISKLRHPEFAFEAKDMIDYIYPTKANLTTTLSGKDLSRALNFPRKSVSGLPVAESVAFGRDVYRHEEIDKGNLIDIGKIYHMHHVENKEVSIDVNSLCSHTFIGGSTGKGKSNTIYKLLEKVCSKKKEDFYFMVIEPAKGEYKDAFYEHPEISVDVYGTNPKETELLRINPFEFPEEIHVLEHIDRLTEIFNACWPMYAAMPAILKNAIIKSYEHCGWDMINSVCEDKVYPSFSDVLIQINEILQSSAYSEDNKGDYTGALCTRVESLTTGLNGMIFTTDNTCTSEQLFCENVIVDLSRVGSPETKSLIMSTLVMKLQEYRMSEKKGVNLPLRHITVLEEAHNILKRTSQAQGAEISNIQGKAVEVLSNAIAEMRTYGEGFIIADQAPGLLDVSVIRNTNTKIILCLPEEEDRLITGHSIGLSDHQIQEIAKLEKGVAVVYQNDWQEAVLCKFEKYHKGKMDKDGRYPLDKKRFQYSPGKKLKSESEAKTEIIKFLLSKIAKVDKVYSEKQKDILMKNLDICRISFDQKKLLKKYLCSNPPESIEEVAPLVVMLYDAKKILDNRAAVSIEEWNKQVMDRLDSNLNRMEHWYKNLFLQCLIFEISRTKPEFEKYAYAPKWVDYTIRKEVK